jgi:hypothetical protein
MATRVWSSLASNDMNAVANYSGSGSFAGDDLVFDGTSVVNATATAAIACNSITIAAAYSGVWSLATYAATLAISGTAFSDHGIIGAHTYGAGITANGASATLEFHSGSAVTATACVVTLNGTTGMSFTDNKGITFKQLILGASAIVTSNGSASTIFSGTSVPLTFTNGGTLTLNTIVTFTFSSATGGSCVSITGTPTINGNGRLVIAPYTAASAQTFTIPAMTISGTTDLRIYPAQSSVAFTFRLAGTSTCAGIAYIGISFVNTGMTFYTDDYGIAATGGFNYGSSSASGTVVYYFGASTISCGAVNASVNNSGSITVNNQTSLWSVNGSYTALSAATYVVGSSLHTITNTSTITSNGKTWAYDLTFNASAKTIQLADALTCHDLTHTAGNFNQAGYAMSIASGTFNSGGTNTINAAWMVSGNWTWGASSAATITSSTFTFTGNTTVTTNGKTFTFSTFQGNAIFVGSTTFARLKITAGKTYTFAAGSTYTVTAFTAGDWSGTAGNAITMQSSSTGSQWNLVAPASVTVSYVSVIDSNNSGTSITASDGTNTNNGNNVGWVFFVSAYTPYSAEYLASTPHLSTRELDERLSKWDSANRPANPLPGTIGYNIELNYAEYYSGVGWVPFSPPAGGTANIQYNSSGIFAGSPLLVWDSANKRLGVNKNAPSTALHVGGAGTFDDSVDLASGKVYKVNNAQVVGARGAALTAQLTSITHTAPGTPDYAIQDLTNTGGFGFATKDEGDTVLSVIRNLQTRVAELEARLKATGGHGLIADA